MVGRLQHVFMDTEAHVLQKQVSEAVDTACGPVHGRQAAAACRGDGGGLQKLTRMEIRTML